MAKAPANLSKILIDAYPDCGFLSKLLIRFRPYICPFHELVKKVDKNSSVLEVGCGTGIMTILLAHLGKIKSGIGIDVSQKSISIAQRAIYPKSSKITFKCISENIPWPEGRFNTIISIDVLHHIEKEEQRIFIKKLSQACNDGKVIFKDVSPKPFWKAMASKIHDLLLSGEHICIRSEEDVLQWLKEEGFFIKEFQRLDMLWYSHYCIVAEK